ncbi:hypothetical protein AB0M80_34495 [Amycolatopsis sp. NPDC051045]|uniref:hypothetical protein n=1 Tax=Amycolatopsis sp. NPDC051045 TaxID=3156922 RepID=UPI003441F2C6
MGESNGDLPWRHRPFVRRSLVAVMFTALGWLVASSAGVLHENSPLQLTLIAISAVSLAPAFFAHLFVAHRAPTRRMLSGMAKDSRLQLSSIRREHQEFSQRFTAIQLSTFIRFALAPRKIRGRINEEIDVHRRVLRQRVTTILELPADTQKDDLLIPVLTPLKGELQDDLVIHLDGEPITTLPHHDYLVLITIILDTLLTPTPGSLSSTQATHLQRDIKKAVDLVTCRRRLSKQELKKATRCAERIKRLAAVGGSSLVAGATLLQRLANNYVVVGIIPKADESRARRTISYERYLVPRLKLDSIKDFLGLMMGARPKHIGLSVENAGLTQSYHLLVRGPEGSYVGWQNLTTPSGLLSLSRNSGKLSEPYFRLRRRLGQRYLHLYMRAIPAKLAQQLRLNIKFYEVPPGSLAGAALAAAANFALVLIIALILPAAQSGAVAGENPLGSDFPALVLAFPAVAGAFVGYDSKSPALVGGTLSSKASSLATIVLSVAASGIFMAQQAGSWRVPTAHGVFGVSDAWWQIIVIGALINTIYAAHSWLTRTLSYYWLAHRPDDQSPGPTEQ